MSSFIRNPKEFWSGAIFIFFGVAAVVIGQDYTMGTAGRMGPAYFPTVLGALLAVIGAIAVVRSLISTGTPLEKFAVKELILILSAVLLFGFVVRGAGLVVAVPLIVLVSAFASIKFRLLPSVLLAAGLTVFAILVFIKGLGLPMPVLGSWFGF
ncbi:MAG TPA: tripartite tricarboxylate transporter TctB family protein [Noviherbaspirillum sp.]|nr:tripartite tricarboxylate transporter TctB family protein [Noviherbaspirillum sp.]